MQRPWMSISSWIAILLHIALVRTENVAARGLIDDAAERVFDYIVVGCGITGLVVASRLSEDKDVSVLCLEAGVLDSREDEIMIPYYIGLQPYGFYQWSVYSVPQDQLDGLSRHVPTGKGVGGGSLINGLIWNRGNQESYNSWNKLGNSNWGWNDLLPYFQKSETYTPKFYPNAEVEPQLQNSSAHGYTGPIHVSYPNFYWPQANNWFRALEELGIPISAEPNEGLEAGGYFLPLNIHPDNQTRWDARRGYFDPNTNRTNFNVQTNAQVTRILFEEGDLLNATGVEFASNSSAPRQTVFARREVILAAGAIQTAQLLELSGIGQRSILEPLGVHVFEDLPGVGNNLQDHPMLRVTYPYTNSSIRGINDFITDPVYNKESAAEFYASRTGPWTARPSGAVAFPSLRQVTNDTDARISEAWSAPESLPATYANESTLLAGFEAQRRVLLDDLNHTNTPIFENLNDNDGGLHLALMRPLSRGTTHITTTDPFELPAVDPRWLQHPFDFETMILALQMNQRILHTEAIRPLQPSYKQVPENADIEQMTAAIKMGTGTQFHYSGTAAMLPRELGGVVSDALIVYGTSNLRVVDTSIYPMVPGAHTAAVAFGSAEKAADLIKLSRLQQTFEEESAKVESQDTVASPEESSAARIPRHFARDQWTWIAFTLSWAVGAVVLW